ncbi:MAG: hypothetical protein IAE78_19880 [Myxococcus sp.]|nr:hypothetical protein [Myxococcus sp.]
MKTRLLSLVLLAVGCGTAGSGITDGLVSITRDAGQLAPDSGTTIDAGVDGPPRDIEIVAFLHSQAKQDGGRSYPFLVPRLADVRAQWQWRDGGWGNSQGRLLEDGGYLIPAVPAGEAIVIFPTTQGLVSAASHFDFSWTVQGRPTAELPQPNVPTVARVSVLNLPPWAPGDLVVYSSLETPFVIIDRSQLPTGTTGYRLIFDWHTGRHPLFFGSAGDTFSVTSFRPRTTGTLTYQTATAGGTVSPPDLTLGSDISFSVNLTEPVVAGAEVHLDFPGTVAALREGRPSQSPGTSTFAITQRRGLREVGVVTSGYRGLQAGLPLVLAENIPGTQPALRGRVQWADLRSRDELVASLVTRFDVSVTAAGRSDTFPLFYERNLPVTDTIDLATTLGVPREITIEGQPTTQYRTGVGVTPRLSWDAPARGTATRYLVTILDLVDRNFSRSFVTTKRTFTVPPFTLMTGRSYVAVISAQAGAFDPLNTLFQPAEFESISTITEAFSP